MATLAQRFGGLARHHSLGVGPFRGTCGVKPMCVYAQVGRRFRQAVGLFDAYVGFPESQRVIGLGQMVFDCGAAGGRR